MIGGSYHFVNTAKLDVYGAGKIGYCHRSFSATSDNPSFVPVSLGLPLSPIAIRVEVGMRYFPVSFVGIHFNFGVGGGPLIACGVAVKI